MSVSISVKGYVSPENENYKKHSNVLIACFNAKIKLLPKETAEYFGSEHPDLYLLDEKLEIDIPKHKLQEVGCDGFEILVSEMPDGVHKIRFKQSW